MNNQVQESKVKVKPSP